MYKTYSYYVVRFNISGFGDYRDDCDGRSTEGLIGDYDSTRGDYGLADFDLYGNDIEEVVFNNGFYKNGQGYGYDLHRVTQYWEGKDQKHEVAEPKDEIVDSISYYKDLQYFYLRKYSNDGRPLGEVEEATSDLPSEEEARKEAKFPVGLLVCEIVRTYEDAEEDDDELVDEVIYE